MQRIPNKKGICAHIFNVRALDAKQRINFFWPYLILFGLYKMTTFPRQETVLCATPK